MEPHVKKKETIWKQNKPCGDEVIMKLLTRVKDSNEKDLQIILSC